MECVLRASVRPHSHIKSSKIHEVWLCVRVSFGQVDMTGSWQRWDTATILNTYLFQALSVLKKRTHKQNQTCWRSGPGKGSVCVRLLLTGFDTRAAVDATLCQPSRCWCIQWRFYVCAHVYFGIILPLPVCQMYVCPITCLSVECRNAHLIHCLRRSS